MAVRVVKNQHVGWDASNRPINEYVFAVESQSELPSSPWTDPADGLQHIIAEGSRAWDIDGASVYGFKSTGSWKLQFTMNG